MNLEIFERCVDFLDLVENGKDGTEEDNIQYLASLLNVLTTFVAKSNYDFDDSAPEYTGIPYDMRRSLAEKRFPSFGYYNTVAPISEDIGAGEVQVGDAIDDVADIYGDLHEVVWLHHKGFDNAAYFAFDRNWTSHWGMHCRELQLYIHASENGI